MAKIYTRTNSPYWWCSFKHPMGETKRISTRVPLAHRKQAELRASQIEVDTWEQWKQGKLGEQLYTFDQLMVAWIEQAKPGSADLYCVGRLMAFFTGVTLNTLSRKDIDAFKQWRRSCRWNGKPVSDSTIRRNLTTFSAALNYARREWCWDIPNPVVGAKPKAAKHRVRWLRPEEANRLITASKLNGRAKWLPDFIELSFNTGMRKMELLGCSLDRVDLRNGCIHLRPQDQKNGQYGTVPLNRNARKVVMRRLSFLAERYPETRWLFPGKIGRGKDHMTEVRKPFDGACEVAGIKDFRPHDMRHTFASWLVQRGVPLMEVKEAMRHASIKQTEIYAHLASGTAKRVVEILDKPYPAAHYVHTGEGSQQQGTDFAEEILRETRS